MKNLELIHLTNMEANSLVPGLRFSEFDLNEPKRDYIRKSFKDVFVFSTGKNIKQNEASKEFKTPCVRYGELYHMYDEVIYDTINRTNLNTSELHFSEGNEILLPSAGEDPLDIGSASALTKKDVAIGRTINILRPKENNIYNQKYASYYINEKLKKKISRLAKGVSISNVYNSDLKTLYINLPSLTEQNKIASFLTSVDKKINLLTKKKALLESYKKGIMQKIFSQEIRFKDEDGKDFPDWEEKKLGEIGKFKTSSVDKLIKEDEKIVSLVNYMNVYNHQNITNEITKDLMRVSANEKQLETSNLKRGDILFTPSSETPSDIGHSIVVFEDLNNTLYSYHLMRFRPIINLDILYSHYFCNIPSVLRQITRFATGSTRFTISVDSFSKIIIQLPSLEEQNKIAEFLSSIDKKIELVDFQLERNKEFKKGLLQQMFV